MSQPSISAAQPEAHALGAPHPVDAHVGARLRQRRHDRGVSQEQLAQALGLTFQQVQKYERGRNRVSASKLFEAARALDVSVQYFFTGLADDAGQNAPAGPDPIVAMTLSPWGAQVARDFSRLSRLDQSILAGLSRRLVEGDGDLPTAALSAGLSAAELIRDDGDLIAPQSEIQTAGGLRKPYRQVA